MFRREAWAKHLAQSTTLKKIKGMNHDPSTPLKNSAWEVFAQDVARGITFTQAYINAGYKKNDGNAARLSKNELVLSRIEWIKKKAADDLGMTKQELLQYLVKGIITPVVEMDENSPYAQEVTRDYLGSETEKQIIRKRIKSISKMDAAKLLTTMLGWNAPEKVEQKIEIVITKSW